MDISKLAHSKNYSVFKNKLDILLIAINNNIWNKYAFLWFKNLFRLTLIMTSCFFLLQFC